MIKKTGLGGEFAQLSCIKRLDNKKNFLQDLFKNALILIESSRCKDKFCRDRAVIIYPQKDIVDTSDRVKRIYVHCDIRFFRIVSHNEI